MRSPGTSRQSPLSDDEVRRRLWRIYEMALAAADRADQEQITILNAKAAAETTAAGEDAQASELEIQSVVHLPAAVNVGAEHEVHDGHTS